MNLTSLFTREEAIAGLEISDSWLRLTVLEIVKGKKKSSTEIKALAEQELPPGVITGGILKDETAFIKAVAQLVTKTSLKERYAIISLPVDHVYSRTFFFPKSVQGQKLEETMQLTIGFQLPVKPEDVYLDWEKIEPAEQNDIFLATISKVAVDSYVKALESAGLKTIAVEFHPMSFSRVMDLPGEETVLITQRGSESTVLFILKNMALAFMRVLPNNYLSPDKLKEEIRKIKDFYESKNEAVQRVLDLESAPLVPKFRDDSKLGNNGGRWATSLGAALRGLLPRSEDNLVSLMPVGTEEAYEYQKAVTFLDFVSNLTIGLSIFFSVVFIGSWLLMTSLQQSSTKQVDILSALPLPANASELEARAKEFNSLTSAAYSILQISSKWSPVVEELKSRVTSGITVSNMSLQTIEGTFSLAGVAKNRASLNSFRKSLEDSPLLTDVRVPLTNLEQKENIAFSVSLRLKDPGNFSQLNN